MATSEKTKPRASEVAERAITGAAAGAMVGLIGGPVGGVVAAIIGAAANSAIAFVHTTLPTGGGSQTDSGSHERGK